MRVKYHDKVIGYQYNKQLTLTARSTVFLTCACNCTLLARLEAILTLFFFTNSSCLLFRNSVPQDLVSTSLSSFSLSLFPVSLLSTFPSLPLSLQGELLITHSLLCSHVIPLTLVQELSASYINITSVRRKHPAMYTTYIHVRIIDMC